MIMLKVAPRNNTLIHPVEMPTNREYSRNNDTENRAVTTSHFKSGGETTASEFNKLLAEYIMLMENKKHL